MTPWVLITRSAERSQDLQALLDPTALQLGCCPVFDFVAQPHINIPSAIDILIVTSVNAAVHCQCLLQSLHPNTEVIAVGAATGQTLLPWWTATVWPTEGNGSTAVLAMPQLQQVQGKRIVIVRGQKSLTVLDDELDERGAEVESLIVYKREPILSVPLSIKQKMALQCPVAAVATSADSLLQLQQMLPADMWESLRCLPLVAISARVEAQARHFGWSGLINTTAQATNIAFADALKHVITRGEVVSNEAKQNDNNAEKKSMTTKDSTPASAVTEDTNNSAATGQTTPSKPAADVKTKTAAASDAAQAEPAATSAAAKAKTENKPTASAKSKSSASDKPTAAVNTTSPAVAAAEPKSKLSKLAVLAFIIALVALGLSGWQYWQKMQKTDEYQLSLANMQQALTALEKRNTQNNSENRQALSKGVAEVQASFKGLNANVQTQQTQVQSLQAEMTGVSNRMTSVAAKLGAGRQAWVESEVQYLLLVANERLTLAQDGPTAQKALAAADERLAELADPELLKVRQSIATERQAIRAIRWPDVYGLSLQVNALQNSIAQMPLRDDKPAEYTANQAAEETTAAAAEGDTNAVSEAFNTVLTEMKSWVSINRDDSSYAVLPSPSQASLIYRMVELKLEAAQTAALQNKQKIWQLKLGQAHDLLAKWFAADTDIVNNALLQLKDLQGQTVAVSLPEIGGSIAALRRIVKARELGIAAE